MIFEPGRAGLSLQWGFMMHRRASWFRSPNLLVLGEGQHGSAWSLHVLSWSVAHQKQEPSDRGPSVTGGQCEWLWGPCSQCPPWNLHDCFVCPLKSGLGHSRRVAQKGGDSLFSPKCLGVPAFEGEGCWARGFLGQVLSPSHHAV